MFKKKSIDGGLCFCPFLPLPEVNPTVSEQEHAVCQPRSLSSWGWHHRRNSYSFVTGLPPVVKIKPCGVEVKPVLHPIPRCSFLILYLPKSTGTNHQKRHKDTKSTNCWLWDHGFVTWLLCGCLLLHKMKLVIVTKSKAHRTQEISTYVENVEKVAGTQWIPFKC